MKREGPSAVRKALLWWFDWPGNPYVSVSVTVDFTAARRYLDALNAADAPTVSVHHLAVAAIARVLTEFPIANARIIGKRIERVADVGVGMPVNLLGHGEKSSREVGAVVLERVGDLTLREIAAATQRMVSRERSGDTANPFIRHFTNLIDRAPYPMVARGLDALDWMSRRPALARALYQQVPLTAVITNAGAPIALREGMLFRAAAMELPQRILHVGTVWGLSTIQDEVLAIGGVPCVRPALPVAMVFDHRIFDGVMAGRLLVRLGEILLDPESVFGPTGDRTVRP